MVDKNVLLKYFAERGFPVEKLEGKEDVLENLCAVVDVMCLQIGELLLKEVSDND